MSDRKYQGDRLVLGLLLVLVGTAMLLDNQVIIDIGSIWRYWPLILVVLGVAKLIESDSRSGQSSGIWLLLLGLWLQVSILGTWGLSFGETWPALLIVFGVSMLWKNLPPLQSSSYVKEQGHG